MPRYIVILTEDETKELNTLVQKGGKGYRIEHAQILMKLDKRSENEEWTYDRIKDAYGASHSKVTGKVEAQICLLACSEPPERASRWTMQMIDDELIRLEVVDYITDSKVCVVMRKNEIKPWQVKEWCIPKADAEFVAKWRMCWMCTSDLMTRSTQLSA